MYRYARAKATSNVYAVHASIMRVTTPTKNLKNIQEWIVEIINGVDRTHILPK
jgi:hypothetical protein